MNILREYRTVFGGSVRVFENGNKAWFFNSSKVRYVVHFRNKPMALGPYHVKVTVPNFQDDLRSIEFSAYGLTRREAFTEVRKEIANYRSACRKVAFLKPH